MDGALGANNDIESETWSSGAQMTLTLAHTYGGATRLLGYRHHLRFESWCSSDALTTHSDGFATIQWWDFSLLWFNEDNQNMGVKTSIAGFTVAAGSRRDDGTYK